MEKKMFSKKLYCNRYCARLIDKKVYFFTLFFLFNFLFSEKIFAQTADDSVNLRTILVTATRTLQDLMDVPMSVNVITAEDLEDEPYVSINDALATIQGLQLDSNTSGARAGAPRISIRGEGPDGTLIMINGVKTVDKDRSESVVLIDLSQIERIELIKGPASVLYGAEALGGVINIITKKGGRKPFGFSQNLVYDSSTTSLDVQSAIFGSYKGINYRLSGSGVNVHDRKVPKSAVDGGEAFSSQYKNRYSSAQLGYEWGSNNVSIKADRFRNTSFYSLGESNYSNDVYMWIGPNDRDTLTGSMVLESLSDYLSKLTLTSSYQTIDRHIVRDFRNNIWHYEGRFESKQKDFYISAQAEWSLGPHYLISGAEYDGVDLAIGLRTYWTDQNTPTTISNAKATQQSMGFFVQDDWTLREDLKANIGVRFSKYESEYKHRDGPNYQDIKDKKKSHSRVVGSFGLVYRGFKDWALRAQYAQGYRYPTLRQLFTGDSMNNMDYTYRLPNPDLKPEISHNFEIGARFMNESWDFDLALFFSKAKNYIHDGLINGQRSYVNGSQAETYGAELSISHAFAFENDMTLTPYGSAIWLKRSVGVYGNPIVILKSPPLEGRIGLKFQKPVWEKLQFFSDLYGVMAVRVNDSRLSASSGTLTDYPAWQTLNLSLGIKGGTSHKYHATIGLRNIFNQAYFSSKSNLYLPEAGFHIVASLGFEY
jgi:hemoglobin/transferrin/lactoferrin receptor protein